MEDRPSRPRKAMPILIDDLQLEDIIRRTVAATHSLTAAEHERVKKTVDKMHDTLYGNGKEGLTTTVDRLELIVNTARELANKVIAAVVIAIVIGVIILVAQANLLR